MFTYVTTDNHNNEFPQHLYYENCTKRMGGNEEIGTNGEKVGLPINPPGTRALKKWLQYFADLLRKRLSKKKQQNRGNFSRNSPPESLS